MIKLFLENNLIWHLCPSFLKLTLDDRRGWTWSLDKDESFGRSPPLDSNFEEKGKTAKNLAKERCTTRVQH